MRAMDAESNVPTMRHVSNAIQQGIKCNTTCIECKCNTKGVECNTARVECNTGLNAILSASQCWIELTLLAGSPACRHIVNTHRFYIIGFWPVSLSKPGVQIECNRFFYIVPFFIISVQGYAAACHFISWQAIPVVCWTCWHQIATLAAYFPALLLLYF